jgi:hypothetical protein
MARGKRKDPESRQPPDLDPLRIALEKDRAEREQQELLSELRRRISAADDYSKPTTVRWGSGAFDRPAHFEAAGTIPLGTPDWDMANADFATEWVGLWVDAAETARRAGLADRIRELDPAVSAMPDGPPYLRPLIIEMHGLFSRILGENKDAAAGVVKDLANLRKRCEPTAEELGHGKVLIGRRWNAGKYFTWLRKEVGRWATRPKAVDRTYVTDLAREHCLVADVPEDVARAVVDMMCTLGVLHEIGDSGVEIPGKPGVIRDRTDQAGAELKRMIHAWIASNPAFDILGHIVLGTGSSGSGAGLAQHGGRPQDEITKLRQKVKYAQESLDKLTYDSAAIIEGMGASVAKEATVVVGAIRARALHETALAKNRLQNALGQSDQSAAAGPGTATKVPSKLTERQRLVVAALAELKARSREQRRSAEDVAKRAFGNDDASNAKQPLADLKRLELVDSVEGRGGGSWLTQAGVEWARANGIVRD